MPTPSPPATSRAFSGDTLRIVMPVGGAYGRFSDPAGDPAALDPHRDWPAPYDTSELYRCCLARMLLSTNGQSVDRGGSHIHPDVAMSMPEVSVDGLSWTFKLREGLRYAPPLESVEITAQDFIRSFHRLMRPEAADEYWPSLFEDVVGAADYRAGTASSIAGFSSPDPYTLVIRLTEPAGDLAPRLATFGVIPIPPNPLNAQSPFGIADGHDDGFGRFVVSSGPYMIEGSPDLDFSKPAEEQFPVAGLVPGWRLVLVPNPSWDPASDSLRGALPGRIEIEVVNYIEEAVARIHAGTADIMINSSDEPPVSEEVAEKVRDDPSLGRTYIYEAGRLLGLTMKTAMPPFDDIHVRRAVNHVVNKQAALETLGGSLVYRIAHHVAPDSMEDNLLLDYRPYGGLAGTGDVEAAKAEMRQSKYDTNQDGICDASVCQDVPAAIGGPELEPGVRGDLMQIGISVVDGGFDAFEAYTDPSVKAALYIPQGWGRDYLSASNFFVGQFYSPAAFGQGNGNASLVGASPEQLADWGYDVAEVPNVDARIEACVPLTGAAQLECWAALDQHMMENVASFVPLGEYVLPVLASSRVMDYHWDELSTAPAYDRIELPPYQSAPATAPPLPSYPTDPEIEGVWQTEPLTTEKMGAALAAAGLDPNAAEMIAEAEGFNEYIVFQVQIEDGRWVIYNLPDGEPVGFGWLGTYQVDSPGRITATDGFCSFSYAYEIVGEQLHVDLVSDPCDPSGEDEIFQTAIFESTPFTRIE